MTDKENLDNKLSKINIVIGDDHGQEIFRSVSKFIMRDKEGYNKDSYVIKNGHIDCTKDTNEIFQRTIATPINNQQSTINNQQSTINNQQSIINNQQSTINNHRMNLLFHFQYLFPYVTMRKCSFLLELNQRTVVKHTLFYHTEPCYH